VWTGKREEIQKNEDKSSDHSSLVKNNHNRGGGEEIGI